MSALGHHRWRAGAVATGAAIGVLAACGHGGAPAPAGSSWTPERLRHATAVIRKERGIGRTAPPTAGSARIGALFHHDSAGDHFCSASVVKSPGRDLVLTAAHCINGGDGRGYKSDIVFVPGYRAGATPDGVWQVKSLLVGKGWARSADPDADVGFVVLRPLGGRHIEDVLGGNTLGVDTGYAQRIRLTGYPAGGGEPVSCFNRSGEQSPRQLRIACTGFPGGTSGSPWLTGFDPATRTGTVVGVIGGYEQGGDTPDVSYSPYFDHTVHDLYLKAVAQEG